MSRYLRHPKTFQEIRFGSTRPKRSNHLPTELSDLSRRTPRNWKHQRKLKWRVIAGSLFLAMNFTTPSLASDLSDGVLLASRCLEGRYDCLSESSRLSLRAQAFFNLIMGTSSAAKKTDSGDLSTAIYMMGFIKASRLSGSKPSEICLSLAPEKKQECLVFDSY